MKTIESILSSDIIQALGWAVFHSIWQALVIALVVLLLQAVFRQMGAHLKYVLYTTGLFAMVVCLVFTFVHAYGELQAVPDPVIKGNQVLFNFSMQPAAETYPESTLPVSSRYGLLLKDHIGLITVCWLLGAILCSLRLFGGLFYVQRLMGSGTCEVPGEWAQKLHALSEQLGIHKSIRLLSSVIAETPMVIGHFKPVILLPAGLLAGLSTDQVEAVLAHELAHIRRNDWLVNLLQSIVETLFFFHPVAWWLSARMREEREKCCDDIAVQTTGDALIYVRALSAMQEVRGPSPTMAMAFGKKKYLLERIRRLVSPDHKEKALSARLILLFITLTCITVFAFALKQDNQEGNRTEVLQSELPVFTEKGKIIPAGQDTLPGGKDQQEPLQKETNREKKKAEKDKKDKDEEAASGWEDSNWDEETVHEDFSPFHVPEPMLPPEIDSLLGNHPSNIFHFPHALFNFDDLNGFPFEAFPPELFFNDLNLQFQDTLIFDGFSSLDDSSFSEMKEELLEARRLSQEAREEYMEKISAYREKIREHQDKLRDLQQSYHQELREYQEDFREEHKKQQEHQLRLRKKQMESMREAREAQQRQLEGLREQHEALQLKNEQFSQDLREELESDGLINEDEPVDFRYNADTDEIKINGRELNKKQKNKYRDFLEQHDHLPSSGSFRYQNK